MAEQNSPFLQSLIKLSSVDSSIGRIALEKKRLNTELARKKEGLQKLENEHRLKLAELNDRRIKYQKEERILREERDKLTERRKALETLGSFKLQQAAEREIDHAARQISEREEALLSVLQIVEDLEKGLKETEESVKASMEGYRALEAESKEIFSRFEQDQKKLTEERELYAKEVEARHLSVYERVRERNPLDPIAKINSGSCSLCFMAIGPQMTVEIGRGQNLVKCPGCSRILHV